MKEKIAVLAGIIGFILLIAAGWTGWNYFSEKERSKYSLMEFELRKALEAGNLDIAKKAVKDLEKSSQYKPLALSYLIHIEKNVNLNVLKDLVESIEDKQLKAFYIERYAYELFKHNQKAKALSELEKISKEDFNYVSAMLLKAQILLSENKKQEAHSILQSIMKNPEENYFSNLAYALLLKGGFNE